MEKADEELKAEEQPKACTFFRARKRFGGNRNIRGAKKDSSDEEATRRSSSEESDKSDSDDSGDGQRSAVVTSRRKRRPAGLIVGRSEGAHRTRKRRKGDTSSDDSSTSEDERPSAVSVDFKGTGEARAGPQDMGATATAEYETEANRDARAQEERAKAAREGVENALEDKTYRGMKAYAKYIEKKDTPAGSAAKMSTGPQRAPTNVRMTTRWDYAPDICKDYKETGFCGFGDSCKFLHDRSDYKHGWQLEREMEEGVYGAEDEDDGKWEISSDEDDLPFKCFLCRDSFVNPVVTRCKHYFCEKCALEHYRKSQRCRACGKQTGGVFNPAKEIVAKLKRQEAEEAERRREERVSDGDEEPDDEDDVDRRSDSD